MKIGILTLNGYHNFGNRLQNYALEQVLLRQNVEVKTLFQRVGELYSPCNERSFYSLYNISKNQVINKKDEIFNYIYNNTHEFSYKTEKIAQFINFKMFSEKYLNEVDHIITGNEVRADIENQYDYFVVGSDQVWNPEWINSYQNCLLGFTKKNKKLTYAPSFGVSELTYDEKNIYREYLKDFKSLSSREFSGSNIIKEILGIEVPVLLDPTFLLEKGDWLEISKEHNNKPSKPYVLTYILGEYSKEMLEDINYLKNLYQIEVVNLRNLNAAQYYSTDPSEFIDFLKDCIIFLTDSFHGVVFSHIFEKNYIVYNRIDNNRSMNSRIETLNQFFNIEKNLRINMDKVSLTETDFSGFKKNIQSLKQESMDYVSKMLKN